VHVHGVDPWRGALARAKEKIALRSTSNVTLHDASGAAMPFGDQTFDLIVSNLGVNNFDDAPAVVRECRRVARDGATLALTTNLQGHMHELYASFEDVLKAVSDGEALRRLREHVAHRATVAGICTLLENGGFLVRHVVERTTKMRFAGGTALLDHHFIKLAFLGAWKEIAAGSEAAVFSRLQERLDSDARERGDLSLTIPMAYIEAAAV
jgi:SAM-dependent methyltransferase